MELNEINRLIDKYFEGDTSLAEEREIASYLATAETLPEEHTAVKTMFEAMGLLRDIKAPEPQPRKRGITLSLLRRVAVATACIVVGVVVATRTMTSTTLHAEPMIVCYVDGARVYDQRVAEDEMRRILGNMNQNVNLAMARIDKVNLLKTK
ncbi:MAG: hypothetical protein J6V55_01385 [Alistipes sp.]|nr:hypothetical protein [Alistipes sp.]